MCAYIYTHIHICTHTYTKNMIWIVPCRWLLGCLQVLLPTTMLEELLNHLQELHQADSERRAGAGRTWETGLRCSTLLRCSTFGWFHWFTTHYQWIYIYIFIPSKLQGCNFKSTLHQGNRSRRGSATQNSSRSMVLCCCSTRQKWQRRIGSNLPTPRALQERDS